MIIHEDWGHCWSSLSVNSEMSCSNKIINFFHRKLNLMIQVCIVPIAQLFSILLYFVLFEKLQQHIHQQLLKAICVSILKNYFFILKNCLVTMVHTKIVICPRNFFMFENSSFCVKLYNFR